MTKAIDEMTYSEILAIVKRRPMWAVDKLLKLSDRGAQLAHVKTELEEIRAYLAPDDSQQDADFMADRG